LNFYFLFSDNATRGCSADGIWDDQANYGSCKPIVNPPSPTCDTTTSPYLCNDYSMLIYSVGYTLSLVTLIIALIIFISFRYEFEQVFFLISTSWVSLRSVSGPSQVRLGSILGPSRVCIGSISGLSRVRLRSVSGLSRVRLGSISGSVSGPSRVRLGSVSGPSRVHLWSVSGPSRVRLVSVSGPS
jgi:hypothetical protein